MRTVVQNFEAIETNNVYALLDAMDTVLKPHGLGALMLFRVADPVYDHKQYQENDTVFYHTSIPLECRKDTQKRLADSGPSFATRLAALGFGPFSLLEASRLPGAKDNIKRVLDELRPYGIQDVLYRMTMVPSLGRPFEANRIMVLIRSSKPIILTDSERDQMWCLCMQASLRFVRLRLFKAKRRGNPRPETDELLLLQGLARGWSTGQIAVELGSTTGKVKAKIERLRDRIKANNAAHAVSLGYEMRWLLP